MVSVARRRPPPCHFAPGKPRRGAWGGGRRTAPPRLRDSEHVEAAAGFGSPRREEAGGLRGADGAEALGVLQYVLVRRAGRHWGTAMGAGKLPLRQCRALMPPVASLAFRCAVDVLLTFRGVIGRNPSGMCSLGISLTFVPELVNLCTEMLHFI